MAPSDPSGSSVVRLDRLSSASISPLFVKLELRNGDDTRGRFVTDRLPDLSFVRSRTHGGAFDIMRLNRHIRDGGTDDIFACVTLLGQVDVVQDAVRFRVKPGDIGLVDPCCEYQLGLSPAYDGLWVRMPRDRLHPRLVTSTSPFARGIDGRNGYGRLAAQFLLAIASQARSLRAAPYTPLSSTIVDLLAAAATSSALDGVQLGSGAARTLDRAMQYIEANLGDEHLSPATIAGAVGISPRYLSSLFARRGETIMGWTVSRRLERCRSELELRPWTPGGVTEIAYRNGFVNLSSFNRAFKARFCKPPRQCMPGRVNYRLCARAAVYHTDRLASGDYCSAANRKSAAKRAFRSGGRIVLERTRLPSPNRLESRTSSAATSRSPVRRSLAWSAMLRKMHRQRAVSERTTVATASLRHASAKISRMRGSFPPFSESATIRSSAARIGKLPRPTFAAISSMTANL